MEKDKKNSPRISKVQEGEGDKESDRGKESR